MPQARVWQAVPQHGRCSPVWAIVQTIMAATTMAASSIAALGGPRRGMLATLVVVSGSQLMAGWRRRHSSRMNGIHNRPLLAILRSHSRVM